jgi:hypothetical protein
MHVPLYVVIYVLLPGHVQKLSALLLLYVSRRVHITRARARARQACNSTHKISAVAATSMCTVTSLASPCTSNVDAHFMYSIFPNFVMNPIYRDISCRKMQAHGCLITSQHVRSKEEGILKYYFL